MYEINFTKSAKESLLKIDKQIARRIIRKIEWLGENFDLIKPVSLKGELSEFYKMRIGDYRVMYTVNREKLVITIHFIGHRKEIYK